ncbi:M90 family metallopeptidase [Hydrogenimonas sp.]
MNYYLFLMQLFLTLLAIFLIWQAILYYRRMKLFKELKRRPLPDEWIQTLQKLPHYRLLPSQMRERLRPRMLYFSLSKEFLCVKCEVTEQMRAVISFYAALMTIGFEEEEPFAELDTVLIYPHEVVVPGVHEHGGIFSDEEAILDGESMAGTVLIAWSEAKHEAFHGGKNNVIVHELAHLLDIEDGEADGAPPMGPSLRKKWNRVLQHHFEELQERVRENREWGEYRLLGEYAATNEAEFFAVCSERFFQHPHALKTHFPDLYRELEQVYGIDTERLFSALG